MPPKKCYEKFFREKEMTKIRNSDLHKKRGIEKGLSKGK